MALDWLPILKGQAKIVTRLARLVPAFLARPDLGLDQALHIHEVVEQGARGFQRLLDDMRTAKADDKAMRAARVIETIWGDLCAATALKVRDIRIAIPRPSRRPLPASATADVVVDLAPTPQRADADRPDLLGRFRVVAQRLSSAGSRSLRSEMFDRGRVVLAKRANALAAILEEVADTLKDEEKPASPTGKGWLKPNQIIS